MSNASIADAVVAAVLRATEHPSPEPVVADDAGIAARLVAEGRQVVGGPLHTLPAESVAAAVLIGDELSHAGEDAEALVHEAARALRPHGLLAATARNRLFAELTGLPAPRRGFSATELDRLIGHYGFMPELLCAPGAAGRLRASLDPHSLCDDAPLDIEADRHPGLLDAGPHLLALARRAADPEARSSRFFATLPRKVIAAAVLCRADDGRMLVVHDSFRRHWTIPGGVVDADESPRDGAEREAREEAGLPVAAGPVLGVFAGTWPDRVVFVYDGVPVGGGAPTPAPVHEHEIDAAQWVSVREALDRLAPHVAFQVRRCLSQPGGTWVQPRS